MNGILSSLGPETTGASPRGRTPPDRDFYTYGQSLPGAANPGARPNSMPGGPATPGARMPRAPNNPSGAIPGGLPGQPGPLLRAKGGRIARLRGAVERTRHYDSPAGINLEGEIEPGQREKMGRLLARSEAARPLLRKPLGPRTEMVRGPLTPDHTGMIDLEGADNWIEVPDADSLLEQQIARHLEKIRAFRKEYGLENSPLKKASGGDVGVLSSQGKVDGPGSGREDKINALLSDGEYVIDAESVALLGDGSGEEGARRLDEMRRRLRAHKGQALARGKFSPDAKRPEQYLKGQ